MEKEIKPNLKITKLKELQDKGIFLHQNKKDHYFNVCACGGVLDMNYNNIKVTTTGTYILASCKVCCLCYRIEINRAKKIEEEREK